MWGKTEEDILREKERKIQYAKELERQREQDRLRKEQEKKKQKELDKKEEEKIKQDEMRRKLAEKAEKEKLDQSQGEIEQPRVKTPPVETSRKDSLPSSPAPPPASSVSHTVSPLPVTPTQPPLESTYPPRHLQMNEQNFMLDLAFKQAELSCARAMDKITADLTNEIQRLTAQFKDFKDQAEKVKEENNQLKQELTGSKQDVIKLQTVVHELQAVVKKHERKIESLMHKKETNKQPVQLLTEDDLGHDVTKSLVAESKFIFPDNTTIQKANLNNKYSSQYHGENVDRMYQRANEKLRVLNNLEKDNSSNSLQLLLTQINQTNKI